ncbi:MAG: UbiA family prenyltransferase, partial [Pirellulales bacterium]|nr:UbiA family prenyltransferase [Pirellulales bacterium]
NVFMLPGVLLALILAPQAIGLGLMVHMAVGVISVCLVASANYVINEYLDAQFDRFHPIKRLRPCVSGAIRGRWVAVEYLLFGAAGLGLAAWIGPQFLGLAGVLLLMGVLYNVRPFRTKDRQYLDVLSESVNNPLRFLLGWSIVLGQAYPPSSILITYWMGGAFLMGIKRYSEYRAIADPDRAGLYRRSFRYYTEASLLLSSFFYALVSSFFLGIFLIKYRIEFLLTFPLFALLFTWYLAMGMKEDSAAQAPEKLFRERRFMAFTAALGVAVLALFYVDIPWLRIFLQQNVYGMP